MAATFFLILPCLFSWLLELDADFKAVGVIGIQEFVRIKTQELKPNKARPIFIFVFDFLTHPPAALTIFLWKRLQTGQNKFMKEVRNNE